MQVARDGLKYVYESMQYVQEDGSSVALKNAITDSTKNKLVLKTKVIKGIGHRKSNTFRTYHMNIKMKHFMTISRERSFTTTA